MISDNACHCVKSHGHNTGHTTILYTAQTLNQTQYSYMLPQEKLSIVTCYLKRIKADEAGIY